MPLNPVRSIVGCPSVDLPAEAILADPAPNHDISWSEFLPQGIQYTFLVSGKIAKIGSDTATWLASLAEESAVVAVESTEVAASTMVAGVLMVIGVVFSAGDTRESSTIMSPEQLRCLSNPYNLSPECAALRIQTVDIPEKKISPNPGAIRASASDAHPISPELGGAASVGLSDDVTPVTTVASSDSALRVTLSSKEAQSLAQLQKIFQQLAVQWPRVDGKIDLSLVKRPVNLGLKVNFSDGKTLSIEALLRRIDKAMMGTKKGRTARAVSPANTNSNDYLMWVLRQVAGDPTLQSTSPVGDPKLSITVSVQGLSDWTSPGNIRRILREVWKTQKFNGEDVSDYWVANTFGRRERLSNILSNYWQSLKNSYPEVSGNHKSVDVLDVMYFQIFEELRPHPLADSENKVAHALALKRGEAMPDSNTLEGAFKLAYLIAQTNAVSNLGIFPADGKRELIFYHPKTGQQIYYTSLMHRLNAMIAKDKVSGEKRFESLPVGTPEQAGQRMPDEIARRRLWHKVREWKGQLPPSTTVLSPVAAQPGRALESTVDSRVVVRRVSVGARISQPVVAAPAKPQSGPPRDRIWDPRNP